MDGSSDLILTEELVASARCAVGEGPLPEDLAWASDSEIRAEVAAILASRPDPEALWLFAYGSLLWKPACRHVEEIEAVAHGWHRSFCMRIDSHRGTPEQPGLMMALDRGGQCRGVAYRLPEDTLAAEIEDLVRRELPVKRKSGKAFHLPRWVSLRTPRGPIRALTFVINRDGPHYAGSLEPGETADILAGACGHAGSCSEYLYNTVRHLEERGIRDRNLWRLQALVAERLSRRRFFGGRAQPKSLSAVD